MFRFHGESAATDNVEEGGLALLVALSTMCNLSLGILMGTVQVRPVNQGREKLTLIVALAFERALSHNVFRFRTSGR